MAAVAGAKIQQPPPIDVDDRGVRWHRDGAVLVVERGPSVAAVAVPFGVLLLLAVFAAVAWTRGELGMSVFFAVAVVLPLALGAARLLTRFRIEVDGSGVRWTRDRPRPGRGAWSRRDIDALRYWIDPVAGSWLSRRSTHVALRVRGEWVVLASGLSRRRGRAFTEALALATGLAPEYAGHARP